MTIQTKLKTKVINYKWLSVPNKKDTNTLVHAVVAVNRITTKN